MSHLNKRKEIIEMWLKGNFLDYYCCPNCRDILNKLISDSGNVYYICDNSMCDNKEEYFEVDL